MSRLLTGRNVTWVDKIKESHWSRSNKAQDIIDLICSKNKQFKRGWYTSTKTGLQEFYHSSFEFRRMQELDAEQVVLRWTKRHGITIPYLHQGITKQYVPDFLIEKSDGTVVLEEVKGYIKDRLQHDAKCSAAMAWCSLKGYVYTVNFMEHKR